MGSRGTIAILNFGGAYMFIQGRHLLTHTCPGICNGIPLQIPSGTIVSTMCAVYWAYPTEITRYCYLGLDPNVATNYCLVGCIPDDCCDPDKPPYPPPSPPRPPSPPFSPPPCPPKVDFEDRHSTPSGCPYSREHCFPGKAQLLLADGSTRRMDNVKVRV